MAEDIAALNKELCELQEAMLSAPKSERKRYKQQIAELDERIATLAREEQEAKAYERPGDLADAVIGVTLDGMAPLEKLSALEPETRAKLDDLKVRVAPAIAAYGKDYPEVVSDVRLLRYLRAYKYNVDEANEKFVGMLQWRAQSGVDAIRDEVVGKNMQPKDFPYFDIVTQYWRVKLYEAMDKEGNPVCWDLMGEMDPAQLLTDLSEDQVEQFHLYHMEYRMLYLYRLSMEQDRLVQVYDVRDLQNVGLSVLRPCNLSLMRRLSAITSDNYCETTRRVTIMHCPWIFSKLWKYVKDYIPERTQQKIKTIKSGREQQLYDDITEESIAAGVAALNLSPC